MVTKAEQVANFARERGLNPIWCSDEIRRSVEEMRFSREFPATKTCICDPNFPVIVTDVTPQRLKTKDNNDDHVSPMFSVNGASMPLQPPELETINYCALKIRDFNLIKLKQEEKWE